MPERIKSRHHIPVMQEQWELSFTRPTKPSVLLLGLLPLFQRQQRGLYQ